MRKFQGDEGASETKHGREIKEKRYGGVLPEYQVKGETPYEFYEPIDKVGDYNEHTTNYPATSRVTDQKEYVANANPNEIDITNEKRQLERKLQSTAFRNRYRENYKLVTGEYPSEEELDARLQQQLAFTSDGPDYSLLYPYVENLNDTHFLGEKMEGSNMERSPIVNPFDESINPLSLGRDASIIAQQHDRGTPRDWDGNYFNQGTPGSVLRGNHAGELSEITGIPRWDIERMTDKEVEQMAIDNNFQMPHVSSYPWMISDSMDSSGNRSNYAQGDVPDSTNIVSTHELAHTYNTGNSQLWDNVAFGYDETKFPGSHNNRALLDYNNLDAYKPEKDRTPYDNWIKDLLGYSVSGWHSSQPGEISSAKAETEARMLNAGLWDAAGDTPFSSEDFDNFMNSEYFQHSSEAKGHLTAMGAMELKKFMKSRNEYQLEQDAYNSGDSKFRSEYLQRFKNKDHQKFYDEQGYTKEKVLEMYNSDKKRQNKKATQFYDEFDAEFGPEHMQGIDEKLQYRNEHIRTNEGDVRSKLDKYFNMLAQNEGQSTEPTMARYGGGLPKAQFGKGLKKLQQKIRDNRVANTPVRDATSEEVLEMLSSFGPDSPMLQGYYNPREKEIVMYKDNLDTLKHEQVHASQYGPLQRMWYKMNDNGMDPSYKGARIQDKPMRKAYRKLTKGKNQVQDLLLPDNERTFNAAGQYVLNRGEEFEAVLSTGINAAQKYGINFDGSFDNILSQLNTIPGGERFNNLRGLTKFMSNAFTDAQRDIIFKAIQDEMSPAVPLPVMNRKS